LSEPSFQDIDLGIFVSNTDTSAYWDYECKISQQIEDAIPSSFPVETKVINNAPLSFCFNVIRGKLLFARDEDLLVDFMKRTAKKYLDSAPLIHKYMREAMA
jgi:predicted nucleotidyltransferase